ncbi:hypothetical protein [Microbacterium enclense]|uniref:hypothetical protein n=1 Tax=Microbacterium enclense TaxID=993073 RepID=UPI0013E34F0F|nr:hypothetical protein [Microbacterium enclense]
MAMKEEAVLRRSDIAIEALGVAIDADVEASTPDQVLTAITHAWRDCDTSAETASRRLELPAEMFRDLEQGLSDLSTRVTLEALDALRGTRLLLHAAGVAAPDGRVLAMVGPSGRGKTTASRHAGRRFGYVSDESVAVDANLTVWPYRKPLSVIVEGKSVKQQIAPSDLGLLPLPDAPLHLSGITLLDRDPATTSPGAQHVDLIDAICEMTPQISYLPELPNPLQYVARIVDRLGAVTRLIYRDATDLPDLITEMFAAPAPAAQSWSAAPPASPAGPWEVSPVDDAILVDGRACILQDGTVTALDERGCLVWVKYREGATVTEITDAAVAAFGTPAHASARALIEQTIDELRAHGLLSTR